MAKDWGGGLCPVNPLQTDGLQIWVYEFNADSGLGVTGHNDADHARVDSSRAAIVRSGGSNTAELYLQIANNDSAGKKEQALTSFVEDLIASASPGSGMPDYFSDVCPCEGVSSIGSVDAGAQIALQPSSTGTSVTVTSAGGTVVGSGNIQLRSFALGNHPGTPKVVAPA